MRAYEKILRSRAEEIRQREVIQPEGEVAWSSPSNIAIVKYWGKYTGQIPANASLSLTLSRAVTKTRIRYNYSKSTNGPLLNFTFDGTSKSPFAGRVEKYLREITEYMPWLKNTELAVSSENTFPHSSGIASSASAMSALAVGLCSIEALMYGDPDDDEFRRKSSYLARIGSGSAARSVYGKMAVWGLTSEWKTSSDEYAIPVNDIHAGFHGMRDSILIIESGKKEVSSSLGHDLMKTNHYAKLRFEAAEENMQRLHLVLKNGDWGQFIDIMENEALSLHAMMMTSSPGFILMKPNTIEAIARIKSYRKRTGISIGFTLDAGANVHVLYPVNRAESIHHFINTELKELCENGVIIHDEMGQGPAPL